VNTSGCCDCQLLLYAVARASRRAWLLVSGRRVQCGVWNNGPLAGGDNYNYEYLTWAACIYMTKISDSLGATNYFMVGLSSICIFSSDLSPEHCHLSRLWWCRLEQSLEIWLQSHPGQFFILWIVMGIVGFALCLILFIGTPWRVMYVSKLLFCWFIVCCLAFLCMLGLELVFW
jgi:hypothetical protein